MTEITDIVIIGSGSAGCALAARLSEDPKLNVALLEAGSRKLNPWVPIPGAVVRLLGNPQCDWLLESGPEPYVHNRMIPVPRGKMLGGTGSMGGGLYIRGYPEDYDRWNSEGLVGWGWSEVLPYFLKAEGNERGTSEFHNGNGPLGVSDLGHDRLSDAFIAAAVAAGHKRTGDFNGKVKDGAGYYQMAARKGRRASTAEAYLKPALGRPNLRLITDAYVTKLEFEGRRCVGLTYLVGGETRRILARAEVIVSAGTYLSPAILQRSGVGPASLLRQRGIDVVADRRDVGENLQDHLHTRVGYKTTIPTLNGLVHSPLRQALAGAQYMLTRKGFLAYGIFRAGLFCNSPLSEGWPDLQFLFGLVSYDEWLPHSFPGCSINVIHLRPESRGRVHITDADPLAPPSIVSNFLSSEHDRKVLIHAVRLAREIAKCAPLSNYLSEEFQPGPEHQSDEALLEHVKATAYTVHHPVGTCRMGVDDEAVVDARLRVKGVEGLRVVDASVTPRIMSGNTNAPAIMIAEKAADMIKDDLKAGVSFAPAQVA